MAADISGTWEMTTVSQRGERKQDITFKQEGEKLTGSISGFRGDTDISDGTIKNGEFDHANGRTYSASMGLGLRY